MHFTWLTPPGSYRVTTCREREFTLDHIHTFWPDKDMESLPGWVVVVVVDLCFTTLLTSQVIIVAFYSEREKSDKFCSEALISAWGSFTCHKCTTRDPRLYFPSEGSHAQGLYALKKSIDPSREEWSAQCRGYLRDNTNIEDYSHHSFTHSNKADMIKMVMMAKLYSGNNGGLKISDNYLTGEENPENTSPRKLVPTGARTQARCVTGAHATAWPTAVNMIKHNK